MNRRSCSKVFGGLLVTALCGLSCPDALGENPIVELNTFQRAHSDRIAHVREVGQPVPAGSIGVIFERLELTALPPSVAGGKEIKLVVVRGGRLTLDEPMALGLAGLPSLTYLAIDGAKISGDPALLGRLSALKHLRLLRVSGMHLGSVPDSWGNLAGLEALVLSRTGLTTFPSAILRCRKLQALSVSNNYLRTLDPALGSLAALEFLDVADNCLAEVNIPWPKKLRVIDLSKNKLPTIPAGLRALEAVEHLQVHDNYIATIAAEELPRGPGRLAVSVPSYTKLDALDAGGRIVIDRVD
jgi:Leucine-rich repeat (LRR) protein